VGLRQWRRARQGRHGPVKLLVQAAKLGSQWFGAASVTARLGSGDGEKFTMGCPSGSFIEVRVRVHVER
jgi:hypothetical protein